MCLFEVLGELFFNSVPPEWCISAEYIRSTPALVSSRVTAVFMALTDLPKIKPILRVSIVANATKVSVDQKYSGSARCKVLMLSLCPLSDDVGTTDGNITGFLSAP